MARDSEIHQFHPVFWRYNYVGGFEVAINYWRNAAMQIIERVTNLQDEIGRFGLDEPAAGRRQLGLERLARDVLHDEIVMVALTEAIGDFWNTG
jgi:hypothetical protein